MAPVEKKAVKTWKYGKCSQVFQQKQSFSGLMCTNCGTKKFYCNDCLKSFSHSDTLTRHQSRCKGVKRQHKCKKCEKEFKYEWHLLCHASIHEEKQESRCPYCGKSYILQNHFHTHVSNCSKQPAKQVKTSTLPQDPHINDHDDDPYTADLEDIKHVARIFSRW